jgi:hypothetical protein
MTFPEHLPVEINAIKFLGLKLDSHLSWKPHLNYLLHMLSSVCFLMKLSHVLNIQTLRTVYFAYFHRLVNYGLIFWGYTSSVHKLFPTQKKMLRTVLGISSKEFLQ